MRRRVAWGVLIWGLAAGLAACGGGSATNAPQDGATVGAAGGEVTGPDGVRITVPAGSLAAPVALGVSRDTTGLAQGLAGAPDADLAVALSPTYALTPHGTSFLEPAEVRIPIDRAAAAGPGLLVALHAEEGATGWDVVPIGAVVDGQAVVRLPAFSFVRVVKVSQLQRSVPAQPVPRLEMALTLGGAGPEVFPLGINARPYRRLYGVLATPADTLRLTGKVTGLPATCAHVVLTGLAQITADPATTDLFAGYPAWETAGGQPGFAEQEAVVGVDTAGGTTRTTLSFQFDLDGAHRPYQGQVLSQFRSRNVNGATPTVGLSLNAYLRCTTPVDLGGGVVLDSWKVIPGIVEVVDPNYGSYWDDKFWAWATIRYDFSYLPQGFITQPVDLTVAAGAEARFTASAWPVALGEQRFEWWRSDDGGQRWSRVRTTIVSIESTADAYALPAAGAADDQALFRVRFCAMPQLKDVAEACTDSAVARLTVVPGTTAASFSLQPRAVLVRTGQTASFDVVVTGSPTPSVRWQTRPANSGGAWAEVAAGSGGASTSYTTASLALGDNGLQVRAVASNPAGDVPSVAVTASVSDTDVAPTITTQPADLTVTEGSGATFAVAARGTEALSYQWRLDGAPIAGATGPVLHLPGVEAGNAGGYSVVVSNAAGTATSAVATLAVGPGAPQAVAPLITVQPIPATALAGATASFAVGASGTPLSYQWERDGLPIPGATEANYTTPVLSVGDTGAAFEVLVYNDAGVAFSEVAVLTVHGLTPPGMALFVGDFALGFGGGAADGTGIDARLDNPDGLVADAAGNLYVAEANNPAVAKVDPAGVVTTLLHHPNAINSLALGPDGSLYVGAACGMPRLLPPLVAGGVNQPVQEGYCVVGQVRGLTVDEAGGVLVSLPTGNAVYRWAGDTYDVFAGAANVYISPGTSDGNGLSARFNGPQGMVRAPDGTLYVADTENHTIRKVTPAGEVTTWIGTAGVPGLVDGRGAAARLYRPTQLAFDGSGNLYVLTQGDPAAPVAHVHRISPAGDVVTVFNATDEVLALATPAQAAAARNIKGLAVLGSDRVALTAGSAVVIRTLSALAPAVTPPPGAGKIAAGPFHTCAIKADGTVACWGHNSSREVTPLNGADQDLPVVVPGLSGMAQVAVGFQRSCAFDGAGALSCWGGKALSVQPLRDGGGLAITGVKAVTLGTAHGCFIDAGTDVLCWGDNSVGQLGQGTTSAYVAAPVRVKRYSAVLTGAVSLSAGAFHTCALTSAGEVVCWGRGAIGDGSAVQPTGDQLALAAETPAVTGASALASSETHACAALASGGMRCWGANGRGQLGNRNTVAQMTPVEVVDQASLLAGVTVIAARTDNTCAIPASGRVVCWGAVAPASLSGTWTYGPVATSSLTIAVVGLSSGEGHTCALLANGSLECWGDNQFGQLGVGGMIGALTGGPSPPLTSVSGGAVFW